MSIETKNENKPKIDLGLLEEDDEFEEFPADGKIMIPDFFFIFFNFIRFKCVLVRYQNDWARIPKLASAQDHDQPVYILMYLSLDQLRSGPKQSSEYDAWSL